MDKKNILGITMGDPYGIGPEIIVKTIKEEDLKDVIIIGDYEILLKAKDLFAPDIEPYLLSGIEGFNPLRSGVPVLDPVRISSGDHLPAGMIHKDDFSHRGPTKEGGKASIMFIALAVKLALDNGLSAVVTAPISKEAINKAGYNYPGHTELIAEMTKTKRFAMMLAGGPLRVILVTTHCALSQVSQLIDKKRIYNILRLAHDWWMSFFGYVPKLAVAALNPHAGEGGIFGHEEEQHIKPAVEKAKGEGIIVDGPYPADTLFYYAQNGRFDAVVVMYHDQGLIPLKMISFGKGVNCTIGLPIIRTSVDHGTAYDIAWEGRADPSSLKEAIRMARDLTLRKKDVS